MECETEVLTMPIDQLERDGENCVNGAVVTSLRITRAVQPARTCMVAALSSVVHPAVHNLFP